MADQNEATNGTTIGVDKDDLVMPVSEHNVCCGYVYVS
jgi:hypothetical protein